MPSAFEGVVRSVIKEVDHSGELIPVDSLRNSTIIRPYCLLSRKPSTSWFWKPRYTCVNLSIKDILEPSAPEPGSSFPAPLSPTLRGEGSRLSPACHLTGLYQLCSSDPISSLGGSLKVLLLQRKDKAVASGTGL